MRNRKQRWTVGLLLLFSSPWPATPQSRSSETVQIGRPATVNADNEVTRQDTNPRKPVETDALKLADRPLPNAHAHNDYRHTRPLLDALEQGFCNIEVDVFLSDDQLLVGHSQSELKPERSLQRLYLEPLREISKKNAGRIYPDGPELTLLVDIKEDGQAAFEKLQTLLQEYPELISSAIDGTYQVRAIRVVVSGDRAIEEIRQDPFRWAGIDGRPSDLNSQDAPEILPWISDNWSAQFHWRGEGEFPEAEREKLNSLVTRAHAAGRLIRFWATPETPEFWQVLLDAKVDLIGTDRLDALSHFLKERKP